MPDLSQKLNHFKPSKITQIFSLAAQLKQQGEDITDLSSGEPDISTAKHVCDRAKRAIDQGITKYTQVDGTSELKQAIQKKFNFDNNLSYELDEIIVDSGAKPLLAHALMAILDCNDEVLIPTPCWPSHPGMVQLCGAQPVFVKSLKDNGFKIRPEDLNHAISSATKALILNSPSNPTGAVYTKQQLKSLADVLVKHPNIWILADDIYEKLLFDNRQFYSIAQVEPRLKDQTITINGLSKAHAMTGWRIGYAGGPKKLMQAIRKVMSQATGSPCAISQVAAISALMDDQTHIGAQIDVYQARRNKVVSALNKTQVLSATPCEGAFYLYVNCQGTFGNKTPEGKTLESSTDFVEYLLEQYKVAVVPGVAFEYDPYFRLSFAASDEQLDKACERIAEACKALK